MVSDAGTIAIYSPWRPGSSSTTTSITSNIPGVSGTIPVFPARSTLAPSNGVAGTRVPAAAAALVPLLQRDLRVFPERLRARRAGEEGARDSLPPRGVPNSRRRGRIERAPWWNQHWVRWMAGQVNNRVFAIHRESDVIPMALGETSNPSPFLLLLHILFFYSDSSWGGHALPYTQRATYFRRLY